MTDQTDLVSAVSALTASAGELSGRLDVQESLVQRIDQQRRGLHSTRIALAVTIIGLALDLGLTIAFGALFHQVSSNEHSIQAVQQRTSTEILCPLYEVVAQSIKANPTPAGLTPAQAELRAHAATVIIEGLGKLGCQ